LDVSIRCAYRKSNPSILVMQAAEHWTAENASCGIDDARYRRILVE
jgi:hypothetical protein